METEVRPNRVCSPSYAIQKAKKGKVLNRWELEDLAKDVELSIKYAKITKKRFPEAEAEICRRPSAALRYANEVIMGRFPEAEETFINQIDNMHSCENIIYSYFIKYKIRNERVELKILEGMRSIISDYAKECVGGRWKEAEKSMLNSKNLHQAIDYHKEIVKEPWGELEDKILFGKNNDFAYWDKPVDFFINYLKNVGVRIFELERKLERCNRASILFAYAVTSIKGRLPQILHQKMMMFSFDPKKQKTVKKYLCFLDRSESKVLNYLRNLNENERQELLAKACTN